MSLDVEPQEVNHSFIVSLTSKLKEFLQQKEISEISVDVKLEEQPCVQIYSPRIEIGEINHSGHKNPHIQIVDGITIAFSQNFLSRFQPSKSINFDLKGLFKKRVEITNIEPIIINVCKV